ncbi:pyridoxal-phosphate-dependent aminotransferase family protein [Pseudoprimorskyibacter insulae]|uniref:Soluble hydrogenase 42 kDa subunit n=1 Tax=Pseudoprimorskyibacter insulae TaxID=1695997 RepID=A0A2R8B0X2_9RHOB|nr:aminotransferase class V-fold PLP-dependent enzyme [Pseudoprimorskyibacter insulae]SPF81911.1 Soluble hydrogenase 42 kDa subunit [Pseudoprimorskyibacter insulae]
MSLAHGRSYLAIPGPSVMPDAVLRAMHRASPNIYEGELVDMMKTIVPDLKRVARTDGHVAIYICNGHGAWEAALANTVAPGEKVLVPVVGRFGLGWAEMARAMGIEIEIIDFGRNAPFDPARVGERLKADTGHEIKAVLAVHVDTSTSLRNDMAGLRAAMDDAGHPALLMADCVASLGCDRFEMDAWGVDVTVSASQKGLMVPAGVGLVFFNDKAHEVRKAMPRVSSYWDWKPRAFPGQFYEFFGGTAPTHHLYGFQTSLEMIHTEGMEAVWRRHEVLAQAIWAAADTWGQGGPLRLNVADPAHRSHAVTTFFLGADYARDLRMWTQENMGVTLGIGLPLEELNAQRGQSQHFRFGHMGHVNAQMILGLLGTVETGLAALNIPHGRGGVAAAADVLAQALVPDRD